ncbi:hypothetical protein [Candidatus Synchoanobacter obligatus]|uniref:DNA polymerase III subunit delta n=1 Tax=Candidatus Synchoanobacter obligatus TaxID=2919597 RepID=A0ABT1L675_9GAMM|nr:hypothetical protein [Candidatus Synchoanobacter obligatus]MCP8352594.1 hypothetical protein [Candidatus Synchoanobacter obligatus]
MIPYYKLSNDWHKVSQHFTIIGPEGLILSNLFGTIQQRYPKYRVNRRSLLDIDDIESFKAQHLSSSLFAEPEIQYIRLSDKLITKFPWKVPTCSEKIIVIYGIEKAPKDTKNMLSFGSVIRTYALKEPFLSREIATLTSKSGLQMSKRGIQWLAISHQGSESLIPATINRLLLIFGNKKISDAELKTAIYMQNNMSAYDILDAVLSSPTKLYIFLQAQNNPMQLFWATTSLWRKLYLTAKNPPEIKQHFPWPNQHKTVQKVLHQLTRSTLATQYSDLIALERHFKGLGSEDPTLLLHYWLFNTQKDLIQVPYTKQ